MTNKQLLNLVHSQIRALYRTECQLALCSADGSEWDRHWAQQLALFGALRAIESTAALFEIPVYSPEFPELTRSAGANDSDSSATKSLVCCECGTEIDLDDGIVHPNRTFDRFPLYCSPECERTAEAIIEAHNANGN